MFWNLHPHEFTETDVLTGYTVSGAPWAMPLRLIVFVAPMHGRFALVGYRVGTPASLKTVIISTEPPLDAPAC